MLLIRPHAEFSYTPASGDSPLMVTFTDESVNGPEFQFWDFGDGTISTEQQPGHTYTDAGIYTITLTVTNPAGSDSMSEAVEVEPEQFAPIPSFTASPTSGPVPLIVEFEGEVENYYYFLSWQFGDESNDVYDVLNTTHTYTEPGVYTVWFYAQSDEGTNYEKKVDYIVVTDPAPVAHASADPSQGPAPLIVNFSENSTNNPTSWHWDFGDGNTSTEREPTYVFENQGIANKCI